MTDTQRPYGLPSGVLATRSRELPDDLPFIAYPTYGGVAFGRAPALLLVPEFFARTDYEEGDNFNPVPFMLAREGFYEATLGNVLPQQQTRKPARARGWRVDWNDGEKVEIKRPGKRMCTVLGDTPTSAWCRQVRQLQGVNVMLSEEEADIATAREARRAAVAISGVWALIPVRGLPEVSGPGA